MRTYEMKEIECLQAQQTAADVHGVPVVLKKSPTGGAGCLDPHELAIMQNHWIAKKAEPAEKKAEPSPAEALEAMRDSMGFPNRNLCDEEIITQFESLEIGGNTVGLWRYFPRKLKREKNLPCLIYLHGGGWVGGTPFAVENPCRFIAEKAGAVVFSVDYALAPEKPFPHGFNDCFGVLEHIHKNAEAYGIDKNKIAMGGDSAGGNLTAACALKDRDLATHMLALQVLIYPCVTMFTEPMNGYKFDIAEYEMAAEQREIIDPVIAIGRPKSETDDSVQMFGLYLKHRGAAYHPYVSPMLSGTLSDLPRALNISAEFDGLRLQDEFYSGLLKKAGVPVKTIRYGGVGHAFIDRLGFVPQAEDLCLEIAAAIREM